MGEFVPEVPQVSFGGTGAYDVVNAHFDNTTAYASEAFDITKQYIGDLDSLLQSLVVPDAGSIDVDSPYVPDMDYTARPKFGNLELPDDWPEHVPAAPVLIDPPVIPDIDMPVMSFSPPEWNTPDKPTMDSVTPPGDAPVLTMPDVPVAPSITLPDAPALQDIVLPSPPVITLPEFDATLPDEILQVPAGFNWEESPYNSDVWNDLLANVLDGLRNGGTGLDPQVEQDIWDRAQSRQVAENDKLFRKIRDTYAAGGYAMPPGALAAAEAEAYQEIARNNQILNSDIAIKQAELAKEHSQFITDKGISLEQILLEFHNAQANRSLDAARAIATSAIEVFNALVTRYNARIDRYKAEAVAYESRVKAALTDVEIFKSMVESARVSSDVQKNLVDVYEKQIAALETHVRMYSTQMESAKIAAEIEQVKLETFRLETQAYVARMDAEKVKFDVYGTEIEAERAKAQTYAEQVRSFVAEVEAKKTETDILISQLDAVLKTNTLLIEQYKGELTGYAAQIDATSKKVGAVVEGFKAEVAGYSAETDAIGQMYGAKIKEIAARIEEARFNMQKAVAEIDAGTKGYVAVKELQVKGTEGIMNVGAQLSASAMNAVNASASLSSAMSESFGKHYNHSQSLGETHYFEEKKQ